MKNLSQIPESELIIVKYKEGMTEVIEAGEIANCIAYVFTVLVNPDGTPMIWEE